VWGLSVIAWAGACGSGTESSPDGGGAGDGPASGLDGPRADGAPGGGCDAVSAVDGLTLHVDPSAGDDTAGTGSATAGGRASRACAFRSIGRAAAAASAAGKKRMTLLVDVTATAGAAEAFPIVLPPDTTLSPAPGATVTVVVAAGDGFHLSGGTSAIESMIIDGQDTATSGVVVSAGPTRLSGVEVKRFTGAGIRAGDGATLLFTAGTRAHDNGAGLIATGTAVVNVDGAGATEAQPTQVSTNAGNGIEVRGQARVNVAGTLAQQTPGAGTVVVKGNAGDGVYVEQLLVAQGSPGPAGMTVTGLVSAQNGASGMHLFGGSGVKVRRSYLSDNTLHGVYVQTDPAFIGGGAGANDGNDVSRLDLGTSGDPGLIVLQDNGNPNGRKGVCLEVTSGNDLNGPLKLQGNVFATGGSGVDCTQIAGSLPATGDCAAAGPLGDVGRNPKNDLDVALCTVP
jgi:hypothetical protein